MTLIQGYAGLRDGDTLVIMRNKKPKLIHAGTWWINKHTPVGEDAEVWESKPHGGRARISFDQIIGLIRPD